MHDQFPMSQDARLTLRHARCLAGGAPICLIDLDEAIAAEPDPATPPALVQLSPDAMQVLRRAEAQAAADGVLIARGHIALALAACLSDQEISLESARAVRTRARLLRGDDLRGRQEVA
jgi:hypothetical protein